MVEMGADVLTLTHSDGYVRAESQFETWMLASFGLDVSLPEKSSDGTGEGHGGASFTRRRSASAEGHPPW